MAVQNSAGSRMRPYSRSILRAPRASGSSRIARVTAARSPRTPLPLSLNTAATRADVARRGRARHGLLDELLRDERRRVGMLRPAHASASRTSVRGAAAGAHSDPARERALRALVVVLVERDHVAEVVVRAPRTSACRRAAWDTCSRSGCARTSRCRLARRSARAARSASSLGVPSSFNMLTPIVKSCISSRAKFSLGRMPFVLRDVLDPVLVVARAAATARTS